MRALRKKSTIVALFTVVLSGCFLQPETAPPAPVPVEQLPELPVADPTPEPAPKRADDRQAVEVVWEIPAEPVEGYIIRYGSDPSRLDQSVKLTAAQVERAQDKERGEVYRYVVTGTSSREPLYVSIAAYSNNSESAPTRLYEVAPLAAP